MWLVHSQDPENVGSAWKKETCSRNHFCGNEIHVYGFPLGWQVPVSQCIFIWNDYLYFSLPFWSFVFPSPYLLFLCYFLFCFYLPSFPPSLPPTLPPSLPPTLPPSPAFLNYRLITAYLLLQVNLDKIMHARWDFDASSAQTQRVSALKCIILSKFSSTK